MAGLESWLVPLWLQCLFAGILVISVFWLPESPRWLYVNGKADQARAMITKHHGEGNLNSAWVSLELREYDEFLEMNGAVSILRPIPPEPWLTKP